MNDITTQFKQMTAIVNHEMFTNNHEQNEIPDILAYS